MPCSPRQSGPYEACSQDPLPPHQWPGHATGRQKMCIRDSLWHISHEGLELEDPANEPNYDHLLVLGVSPEKAPAEGEYVTMTFEKGVPVSVNGEAMKVSDIIRKLNCLLYTSRCV